MAAKVVDKAKAVGKSEARAELADEVVEPVARVRSRSIRFDQPARLAAVVTMLLIVGLVPVATSLRSGGDGARGSAASSSAAAPASGLVHFDRDGLAFDYPASWRLSVTGLDSGLNMRYVTILDFLGTGVGLATCEAATPGQGKVILPGQCAADVNIDPGQIVVELSTWDGPSGDGPIDPDRPDLLDRDQKYTMVGGLPAIFELQTSGDFGATTVLTWTLSRPEQLNSRYILTAYIREPGVEQMQAEVEALAASIRYDPSAPILDPADGPRMLVAGLEQARSDDPYLSCFASTSGASATSEVTAVPGYGPLLKPLPVVCTTRIEPLPVGFWKITLTESWTAALDRSVGSVSRILWLTRDGKLTMTGLGALPSEMPYLPSPVAVPAPDGLRYTGVTIQPA
ncbi:MAG: hypothetical protein ABSE58_06615 [Candidatus Limnocylindrales bacterium]|jgi:hypothetical protein